MPVPRFEISREISLQTGKRERDAMAARGQTSGRIPEGRVGSGFEVDGGFFELSPRSSLTRPATDSKATFACHGHAADNRTGLVTQIQGLDLTAD